MKFHSITVLTIQSFLALLLMALVPGAESLTSQEISQRIASEKQEVASEGGAGTIAIWEEAKGLANRLEELRAETKEWEARTAAIGQLPDLETPPSAPEGAALSELRSESTALGAALETSRAKLTEATELLESSAVRVTELRRARATTRDALSEVQIPPVGLSSAEQARYQRALLNRELLEQEIKGQEAEIVFLEKDLAVLPDRIQLRRTHNENLQTAKKSLQIRIEEMSRLQAKQTSIELEQSLQNLATIPILAKLMEEVQVLNRERTDAEGLQTEIEKAVAYEETISRISRRIREQESSAKQKIELLESVGLGIDSDTGILLREQRSVLPSTTVLQKSLQERVELAVRTRIKLVDLQDELANHPPLTEKEQVALVENHVELSAEQLDALLMQRRSLLETLVEEHRILEASLDRSNGKARETIARIEDYSNFLDERLLWSKSTTPIKLSEPQMEWANVLALFQVENLTKAWKSIQQNWFPRILPGLGLAALFLFSLFRRRRLREIERSSSAQAARRNCTNIRPTLETVASSGLIALQFPSLLFLLALWVTDPEGYQIGFLNAGIFLTISSLLYRFSRAGTLFEAHFKFSEQKMFRLHRALRLFIPIMLPLVFGVGALCESENSGFSGRVNFMITMFVVVVFAHQLLRPKYSLFGRSDRVTLVARVSYLLAVALPLGFAIGAALGFFSSVLTLRAQVLATAGVLLAAFLVVHFFTRWILVSRRKLAIQQALRRREASLAARAREQSGEELAEVLSLEEVKAQAVDVVEVEEQTVQLLRFGVYFAVVFSIFSIWSSSLTALSILDQKPLWPTTQQSNSGNANSSSSLTGPLVPEISTQEEELSPQVDALAELVSAPSQDFVSWQDLLLALLFFVLTFIAARNIPGFLCLVVFSRLKLGLGGNFAFTTIVRYFIVLFGVIMGLNKIGITWDKVQWLAAAITLGIGFGLQEIFANFVAGLILLFERPLRIGDIVTVGEVSGKVTEIKIRATTIQQFNNRELVVPNKNFITNQLTNWTLSDTVLRFDVLVGIAYGSDARKAEEILSEIVNKHPQVLSEPAPQVIFNAFGASTLDFIVRAHVGQVGSLVQTQHELHFEIEEAFRNAEIEIAFPQQDIHIRSLPAGFGEEKK